MSESIYEQIKKSAGALGISVDDKELALFAEQKALGPAEMDAVFSVIDHLREKKESDAVEALLKMSRMPLKEPKTFEGFDFGHVHSKNMDMLKSLPSMSALYARKNIAFIGPQGVGKTHLALAYGRECCLRGMKTYYLKASELNQKLTEAVKYGRVNSAVNGLVRPTCLIIDEIGRCRFDRRCTELFFDIVDRRYDKDCPNTLIMTSNKSPDKWGEYFDDADSVLCAMDRIFDNATVFIMKGDSYRGRRLETCLVEAGTPAKQASPEK